MENVQFDQILQKIIINTRQPDYAQGTEQFILINGIESNLSNLPRLFLNIPTYQQDINSLTIIFSLIRDILQKRGSLLNLQNLQELINTYFAIIGPLIPEIACNKISPACCDIAAYIYRFIFELSIDNPPTFDPALQLVSREEEPSVIFGLKLMTSVIDIMRSPMKHVVKALKINEITEKFKNSQIPLFFQKATEKAFNLNPLITPVALKLLVSIFNFLNPKSATINKDEKEAPDFDFEVPKEMIQFYGNLAFIQNLLQIYQEMNITDAIDVIRCFLSASKCSWKSIGISPIVFINSIENGLTQILENFDNSENATFSITNLIFQLGKLISVSQKDSEVELSPTFISTIQKFSLTLFQSMTLFYNSCNNLLRFWRILFKDRGFIQKVVSVQPDCFNSIFQSYINSIIESITPNMTVDEFPEVFQNFDQLINDFTSLGVICQVSIEPSIQFVSEILNFYTEKLLENNPAFLMRTSMIILIVSSFFNGPVDDIIKENNSSIPFYSMCVQLTFVLITKIDEIQPGLVNVYGSYSILFESALIQFCSLFVKKFLALENTLVYSEEILQFIKVQKKQTFECIFGRLLKDLILFAPFPDTMLSILSFFSGHIPSTSVLNDDVSFFTSVIYSNETFKLLISRSLFIEIESIENLEKQYKLASELNKFYASVIEYEQLSDFVAFIDNKFNNASLHNFTDPREVFVLYREINGLLKGSTSSNKYTFLFRWILQRHSEHTIQCLKAQSKQSIVVKAILRVWMNLLIGKNLSLPSYSSDGLRIIKITYLLLNEVVSSDVPKNDDVICYMVKILAFSIMSKSANFGIMKMYGDDTIDQLILIYFNILKGWPFESYCQFKNLLLTVSNSFNTILQFAPEMIQNDNNFPVVLNFYLRTFIYLRGLQNEYSEKDLDIYLNFKKLLFFFTQKKLFQIWPSFRPHLLALLNTLFDSASSKVVSCMSGVIFLIAKSDLKYIAHVFQTVCDMFDQSSREALGQMSQATISIINENNKPNKKVKEHFELLSNSIKKYSIELGLISEFTPLFTF